MRTGFIKPDLLFLNFLAKSRSREGNTNAFLCGYNNFEQRTQNVRESLRKYIAFLCDFAILRPCDANDFNAKNAKRSQRPAKKSLCETLRISAHFAVTIILLRERKM